MKADEWRVAFGDLVIKSMKTPEMEHYHRTKLTTRRAQLITSQTGIFTHHRRDCWSNVSSNCPELPVKRKIMEHEYEEVIKDEYSDEGHFGLVLKQGEKLELTRDEIINAKPLRTSMAAFYAWGWITREKSWIEGLAAMTITEWMNDDRLLADVGGGSISITTRRMIEDLGIQLRDIPSHDAHSRADEKHSDMFLPFFEEFVSDSDERLVLKAASESLDLMVLYRDGVGQAMEQLA